MKIDVKLAVASAIAAVQEAYNSTSDTLMDDEQRGANALRDATMENLVRVFTALAPWKPVRRTVNGSERWSIKNQVTGKYWCRSRGARAAVLYKSQKTAAVMATRLNETRRGNG